MKTLSYMEIIDLLKIYTHKNIANLVQKYFFINNICEGQNYILLQKNYIKEKSYYVLHKYFERVFHSNHINMIKFIIKKGFNRWNWGLSYACKNGLMDIIQLMIQKGANEWNWGLKSACEGGHIDIVKLMIEKGANDFHTGLFHASINKHNEIYKLMKCFLNK